MKCFIILFKDIFELELLKRNLNIENNFCEIKNENKILRFLIYEHKFPYKSLFELEKTIKENKLSGLIILTIGFNVEKFIKFSRILKYETYVIKLKEENIPNNELAIEMKAKNFDEIFKIISNI
ncbi:MAG: hypothetical protein RQ990_06730 [Candidatus Hydrothermia bacterium]|jgi:hypothetical protein|nr:hypothetical protein [Candidatus Hydrothermia bacterium]